MGNRRRICFSHYLTRTLFQNPIQLSTWQHAGKDTRHFNPLEDYRFFHHYIIGCNCFIIFQYYYLNIKILKFDENFEIFESFKILWQFWILRNFWYFFCNLIGRLEMKYRLCLDNVEAPEVNSIWGTTKKVLFRPISEQQNSLSFNYTITNWRVSLSKICHEWSNSAVTHCAHEWITTVFGHEMLFYR
jgi:hypothetical protein